MEDHPGGDGDRHDDTTDERYEGELDPEEAERRITRFVMSADELPGPSVGELADQVAGLMRAAWSELEGIVDGRPHNKVLAAQLSLGQRARSLQPDDPEQWRLHAATMLLSGMVVRSVEG
jgi:hypothetical protein